jgi:hypothetical protein
VAHASRSSGLLHMEVSRASVFQSGLKISGDMMTSGARDTIMEVRVSSAIPNLTSMFSVFISPELVVSVQVCVQFHRRWCVAVFGPSCVLSLPARAPVVFLARSSFPRVRLFLTVQSSFPLGLDFILLALDLWVANHVFLLLLACRWSSFLFCAA